jgi:hypothetical protein
MSFGRKCSGGAVDRFCNREVSDSYLDMDGNNLLPGFPQFPKKIPE